MATRKGRVRASAQASARKKATFGDLSKLGFSEAVPLARASPEALAGLANRGYSEQEIFELVVPKRTLARRLAANDLLTIEETDKALRLERVAALAERVFGDPAKAHRWLRKPKDRLGGDTPMAFLASESGARILEEMLLQIQHGMFA